MLYPRMLSPWAAATLTQPMCPGPGCQPCVLPSSRCHRGAGAGKWLQCGPGVMPWRCCESVSALSQGRVVPLVPRLGGTWGWAVLPAEWGAPGLCPPRSVLCQQLCSVLQAGIASMKGLLSSCSPSSTAVTSRSQQTDSQCWAQRQGGGTPHSAQPVMAVAEPWAPAGPAFPCPGMGLPCHWLCGVLAGQLDFGKVGALLTHPRARRQPLHWAGPASGWPCAVRLCFPGIRLFLGC